MIAMSDEAYNRYRKLVELAKKLERGCECEYDYRCSNCNTIISIQRLTEEMG